MTNRSPFVITPLPSPAESRVLRTQLDADVTSILCADGQKLTQAVHDKLLDRLTEAVVLAKQGLDLSGAAAHDRSMWEAVGADDHRISISDKQWASLATEFEKAAQTLDGEVRNAPRRLIQRQQKGAGRPVDVWKGALLDDVERALRDAGVSRAYYTTDEDAAEKTVLPGVFRACVKAAGHRVPKDLRNIQRRRFRPELLLPFSASRFSIWKVAKAIWQFLPLKR